MTRGKQSFLGGAALLTVTMLVTKAIGALYKIPLGNLLDEQGKPDPQWLALVERFPQRFMLGSDVVGQFDSLPELMASFDPFLDALPEQVARQVARDNFLAVLPRQPADPRGE